MLAEGSNSGGNEVGADVGMGGGASGLVGESMKGGGNGCGDGLSVWPQTLSSQTAQSPLAENGKVAGWIVGGSSSGCGPNRHPPLDLPQGRLVIAGEGWSVPEERPPKYGSSGIVSVVVTPGSVVVTTGSVVVTTGSVVVTTGSVVVTPGSVVVTTGSVVVTTGSVVVTTACASLESKNEVCLLCEVNPKQIPAFDFICASLESILAIEDTWESAIWKDLGYGEWSTLAGLKLARENLQSRVKEEDSITDVENAVFDLGVMDSLCFLFIDQRVFIGMITKFI
ncbi:hypothetical protein Tco_0793800 [Tanacetum coccineum]